jgi:LysR family glycine cleavage system transcriptional activator
MISCPVSVTEQWMTQVIAGFHAQHPEIEITLNSTVWADEQENASDITITIENQSDVDPSAIKLWEDRLMLLASPNYKEVTAKSLSDERAIHILGRPEYWHSYCHALGLKLSQPPVGFQCNSTAAALELAAAGVGVVVAPAAMAQKLLKRGALVSLLPVECDSPWTYYTSFAEDLSPSAKLFKDWLLKSAEAVTL